LFDRSIKIYRPLPQNVQAPRLVLPDSFFTLSSSELKYLATTQKMEVDKLNNQILKTKKMRDAEEEARRSKYPKTMIRVRFPDMSTVETTFLSGEDISKLYESIRLVLSNPGRKFVVQITPPLRVIEESGARNFWEEGLAPASLVYIRWEEIGEVVQKEIPYFSKSWEDRMEDHPYFGDLNEQNTVEGDAQGDDMDVDEAERDGGAGILPIEKKVEKKVPKWFKIGK